MKIEKYLVGEASHDLSKLPFRKYIRATSWQGDKSNEKEIGMLLDGHWACDFSMVKKALNMMYMKHNNKNVKKELDIIKKIIALKDKSEVGSWGR